MIKASSGEIWGEKVDKNEKIKEKKMTGFDVTLILGVAMLVLWIMCLIADK